MTDDQFLSQLSRNKPGMSDDEFIAQIGGGSTSPTTGQEIAAKARETLPKPGPDNTSRYFQGLFENLNPLPAVKGLWSAASEPPAEGTESTLANILGPGALTGKRLVEALMSGQMKQFEKGAATENPIERFGYGLAGAVPLVGPAAADAGETFRSGDYAKGAGKLTGLLGGMLLGKTGEPTVNIKSTLNPAESSAVAFGEQRGIPVDISTASGNKFLLSAKGIVAKQPLSANLVEQAGRDAEAALARVSGELSNEVHPRATSKIIIGEKLSADLQNKITALDRLADTNYSRLREIAEKGKQSVKVGEKTSVSSLLDQFGGKVSNTTPVMKEFAGVVNTSGAKNIFTPIVKSIEESIPLAQREASPGFLAMKQIVDGENILSLDAADRNLSAIKSMSRTDAPALRNRSQGLAALAVKTLQKSVDDGVAALGPEAQQALADGRQAVKSKYALADLVKKKLNTNEPVKLVNRIIQNQDASITLLKTMERINPASMPELGRSVLEGIFGPAQAEGEFSKTGTALNRWNNLGPKTKQVLYPAAKVKEIDDFLLLSKRLADNANPSGSANVGGVIATGLYALKHPILGTTIILSGPKLARILTSPDGPALLREGFRVPFVKPAGRSLAAAILSRANLKDQTEEP